MAKREALILALRVEQREWGLKSDWSRTRRQHNKMERRYEAIESRIAALEASRGE